MKDIVSAILCAVFCFTIIFAVYGKSIDCFDDIKTIKCREWDDWDTFIYHDGWDRNPVEECIRSNQEHSDENEELECEFDEEGDF